MPEDDFVEKYTADQDRETALAFGQHLPGGR